MYNDMSLKRYVKKFKEEVNGTKDIDKDRLTPIPLELKMLQSRLESSRLTTLGELTQIRLGGFTGCDNAFLISEEKAEKLINSNSIYKELIIPCMRPKEYKLGIYEYLIHIPEGYTANLLDSSCINLEEFIVIHKELFEHFDGLDEALKDALISRQTHFQGNYWWELSKGQCNYDNYKDKGYLVPRISKDFELIDFDGSFLPLNGFTYIKGNLTKEIEDYLRSQDFSLLFNTFYSTDVKVGGYYTRNVTAIKSIKI